MYIWAEHWPDQIEHKSSTHSGKSWLEIKVLFVGEHVLCCLRRRLKMYVRIFLYCTGKTPPCEGAIFLHLYLWFRPQTIAFAGLTPV